MDDRKPETAERVEATDESRPQRAGEAATTRFGMEESDAAEVQATGGPDADEESD